MHLAERQGAKTGEQEVRDQRTQRARGSGPILTYVLTYAEPKGKQSAPVTLWAVISTATCGTQVRLPQDGILIVERTSATGH